jgi:hypothetical protein
MPANRPKAEGNQHPGFLLKIAKSALSPFSNSNRTLAQRNVVGWESLT